MTLKVHQTPKAKSDKEIMDFLIELVQKARENRVYFVGVAYVIEEDDEIYNMADAVMTEYSDIDEALICTSLLERRIVDMEEVEDDEEF